MVCILNVNKNNENDSLKKHSIAFSPQLIGPESRLEKRNEYTGQAGEKEKRKNDDGADPMK